MNFRRLLARTVVVFALTVGAPMVCAASETATPNKDAAPTASASQLNDSGLYTQPWFLDSFMDLREDLGEAAQQGKRFVIMWEQKGCPYCKDMHVINFADAAINTYVRENFVILQLNMWGDREVTDFDGEVLSEKKLARKWGVVFTPTLHYFVEKHEVKANQPGSRQIAAVMPGYFRPFHFISMFEYVKGREYERLHFQKYIAEKVELRNKAGKKTDL